MKTVLVALLGLTGVHSLTLQEDAAKPTFVPVALPAPQDWIAGPSLFPGRVISGDHGELKNYTAKSWATHMLNECKNQTSCTSVLSYQGLSHFYPYRGAGVSALTWGPYDSHQQWKHGGPVLVWVYFSGIQDNREGLQARQGCHWFGGLYCF